MLDDLDAGAAIEGFTASYKLQIGPGTGNAADGNSFSFGPDVTSGSNGGEEGIGTGIIVSFDIYDNGGNEAPSIDVKYGGATIAHTSFTKAEMVTSKFENVIIQLTRSGTLNVTWKGLAIYQNLVLPGFAPSAGQFAIGARTGGENANQWIDDLNIATQLVGPTVPPSITAQPQNLTVNERGTATFAVGFDGTAPLTFQWKRNAVDITDATNSTYTITNVPFSENGKAFSIGITNSAGGTNSLPATLTVNADTNKPTIVSVAGSATFSDVTVVFSEPVTAASAGAGGNYGLSGGLTISPTVEVLSATKVRLTTSAQTPGTSYTLTVNNVQDTATIPNTILAGSTKNFTAFSSQNGGLTFEVFSGITGTTVDDLLNAPTFQANSPDLVAYVTRFTSRLIYPSGPQENYGARLSGWLVPTETAQYEFFIRSDDSSRLFLSPDDQPGNAVMIAEATAGNDPFHEPPHPSTSDPQSLTANNRYAIYALHKEGTGDDYCDVAWRKVGDTNAAQSLPTIPGTVLETYAVAGTFTAPTVTISSPADNSSFDVGVPVTLTATASAAGQKTIAKVEFFELLAKIGEATNSPYSITLSNLTADVHKYTARATDSAGLFTDTAPTAVSIGGLKKTVTLLAIDDVTVFRYDRTGNDLGTAWREKVYDDSSWPQGKTLIADETTTTVEPIRTAISRLNDSGAYVRTFYFRTHFSFSGPITPGVKLQLRHAVDDGAIFYLNGTEIHRFGITDDPVNYLSNANGHENAYEGPFDVSTASLIEGDNVLAVEVHQSGASSSDMVFGAELIAIIPATTATVFAIDDVTTWRYDRTGQDLGGVWRDKAFNDANWPQGKTLIADESTTTVEPIRTAISRFNDSGAYVRTFYFRTHFNFAGELATAKLKLRHVVDDGAIFYLNGAEVQRFGVTDDPVNFLSNANGHENTYEGPFDLPVTNLLQGDNVMAAEVHQSGASSSDMVFGAELVATYFPTAGAAPLPNITSKSIQGGVITIQWINGGTLWSAPSVNGPWLTTSDSDGSYSEPVAGPGKFFRVQR